LLLFPCRPFHKAVLIRGGGGRRDEPVARTYAVAPALYNILFSTSLAASRFCQKPLPWCGLQRMLNILCPRPLLGSFSLFFIDPRKQLSAAAFRPPASEPYPWPGWHRMPVLAARIPCGQCRRPHATKWSTAILAISGHCLQLIRTTHVPRALLGERSGDADARAVPF
jgi:hypothetical protein